MEAITGAGKLCKNDVNKQILLTTTSNMSDKDATKIKYNTLLEEYRTKILEEKLGDAWDNMADLEETSVSKLNYFFVDFTH